LGLIAAFVQQEFPAPTFANEIVHDGSYEGDPAQALMLSVIIILQPADIL